MASSAIPKDIAVTDAEFIIKTGDARLPNSHALDNLPVAAADNADVITVQQGGVGGILTNVTVGSLPAGGGGGGLAWNQVVINTVMVANNAYLISGNREMTLPAASAIGDILRLVGDDNIFTLKQAAGQYVRFNTNVTTVGAGGSITSIDTGSTLELVCREINLGWRILTSSGNLFTVI